MVEGARRKISAVLKADAVGYSRLMGADEATTIDRISSYRDLISSRIKEHHGRTVDAPGDEILGEFPSALDTVRCAVEIQQALKNRNIDLPEDRRMVFRIGVHMGDIAAVDDRIYGDTVNIAARLEELAEPGGIWISGAVYDQVRKKLDLRFDKVGEKKVKNIPEPVLAYRVLPSSRSLPPRAFRMTAYSVATLLVLCMAAATIWNYLLRDGAIPERQTEQTRAERPSIAVLPFDNMSGDPEQEYFSDGMTEEIITRLSMNRMLTVIARNSTFYYKDKKTKIRQIGEDLGVKYVVEGSVRKANDKVRITAQLINAATEGHIWAETYDGELNDIFAIQDEIAQRIVAALNVKYSEAEIERVKRIPTENLSAYESILRGWGYDFGTREGNAKAQELFRHAIELDPGYSEAYSALGMAQWRERVRDSSGVSGLEMAEKAIRLDDSNFYARILMAAIYGSTPGQSGKALAEAKIAIALNPNSAYGYGTMANILVNAGRFEEAIESLNESARLNPNQAGIGYYYDLGKAYEFMGQFDEAITALEHCIRRDANWMPCYFHLACTYLDQWEAQQNGGPQVLDRAVEVAKECATVEELTGWSHRPLALAYLQKKQYARAVSTAEELAAHKPYYAWILSMIYNHTGRPGRTIEMMADSSLALYWEDSEGPAYWNGGPWVLGHAYRLTDRHEDALAIYGRILERNPTFVDSYIAHLNMAITHSELGRGEKAAAEAAEVLKLIPHFSVDVWGERNPMQDREQVVRDMAALRRAGLK